MPSGWCQICGSSQREELAEGAAAPGRPAPRFVLCLQCGHVYQDPIPDEAARLGQEAASDAARQSVGAAIGSWLADLVEPLVSRRTVLAIGDGPDGLVGHRGLLAPFRALGWDICSVASAASLLDRPDDADPGSVRPSLHSPGRTFSLILGGSIERLADPGPRLRFLRHYLDDEGLLFLAMPNLLEPCPSGRPVEDLFRGSSLRLYSPGMGRTLLARNGFRTEQVRAFHGDGVLGLLAGPADAEPDHPFDDPQALRKLFRVLQWPGSTDVLGWNLASLAETQPWALPALCRRRDDRVFQPRRVGRCLVALEAHTADGHEEPVISWGALDGYRRDTDMPPSRAEHEQTIIQLGLGSGELATSLAEQLRPDQHLFIWEADEALARTVLELVDLSPLWLSRQVTLVLGAQPALPSALDRRLFAPSWVYVTDAARQWHPWAYRRILSSLTSSVPACA